MTEKVSNLWLQQWLFHSLKSQLAAAQSSIEALSRLSQQQPSQPLIIGISGAQGSGKTSLAAALQQLWAQFGVQADVVSLDDYYLEPTQRRECAARWHPLFMERGVPGTHDSQKLVSQLTLFRQGQPQSWRRYNKGADTMAVATNPTAARLLIFEGWCVGVEPESEQELAASVNTLEQQQDPDGIWRRRVDQLLAADYRLAWQQLDSLIWLHAPDWPAVCRWRAWQEQPLQRQGKGKSPAELAHFMLYFQRLTLRSWRQLPTRADFVLRLDQEHRLVSLIPDE